MKSKQNKLIIAVMILFLVIMVAGIVVVNKKISEEIDKSSTQSIKKADPQVEAEKKKIENKLAQAKFSLHAEDAMDEVVPNKNPIKIIYEKPIEDPVLLQ